MGLLSKVEKETATNPRFGKGLLNKIVQKQPVLPDNASKQDITLMENLSAGYTRFGSFQGVVLEDSHSSADDYINRLVQIVSSSGAVQKLNSNRCLVLFDSAQDWELIGKHLSKAVPGNAIFGFQAESVQEAFSVLKPYI